MSFSSLACCPITPSGALRTHVYHAENDILTITDEKTTLTIFNQLVKTNRNRGAKEGLRNGNEHP